MWSKVPKISTAQFSNDASGSMGSMVLIISLVPMVIIIQIIPMALIVPVLQMVSLVSLVLMVSVAPMVSMDGSYGPMVPAALMVPFALE